MKAHFVVLADGAEQGESGKLSIRGAGITHLLLPAMPAVGPNISMVAKLVLEEADFGLPHTLIATVRRRDNGALQKGEAIPMDASFSERRVPGGEDEPQSINVVTNFQGIRFERPGVYELGLVVDGKEVASSPLHVQLSGDAPSFVSV